MLWLFVVRASSHDQPIPSDHDLLSSLRVTTSRFAVSSERAPQCPWLRILLELQRGWARHEIHDGDRAIVKAPMVAELQDANRFTGHEEAKDQSEHPQHGHPIHGLVPGDSSRPARTIVLPNGHGQALIEKGHVGRCDLGLCQNEGLGRAGSWLLHGYSASLIYPGVRAVSDRYPSGMKPRAQSARMTPTPHQRIGPVSENRP
jgi:hypothetical protein